METKKRWANYPKLITEVNYKFNSGYDNARANLNVKNRETNPNGKMEGVAAPKTKVHFNCGCPKIISYNGSIMEVKRYAQHHQPFVLGQQIHIGWLALEFICVVLAYMWIIGALVAIQQWLWPHQYDYLYVIPWIILAVKIQAGQSLRGLLLIYDHRDAMFYPIKSHIVTRSAVSVHEVKERLARREEGRIRDNYIQSLHDMQYNALHQETEDKYRTEERASDADPNYYATNNTLLRRLLGEQPVAEDLTRYGVESNPGPVLQEMSKFNVKDLTRFGIERNPGPLIAAHHPGKFIVPEEEKSVYRGSLSDPGVEVPRSSVQAALEKLKFPYHGKYGGPNYGDANLAQKAEDELDLLFKTHDAHYVQGLQATGDKKLIDSLSHYLVHSKDWLSNPGNDLKALAALLGFSVKQMLGLSKDSAQRGNVHAREVAAQLIINRVKQIKKTGFTMGEQARAFDRKEQNMRKFIGNFKNEPSIAVKYQKVKGGEQGRKVKFVNPDPEKDLTNDGIEPNPGPPKSNKSKKSLSNKAKTKESLSSKATTKAMNREADRVIKNFSRSGRNTYGGGINAAPKAYKGRMGTKSSIRDRETVVFNEYWGAVSATTTQYGGGYVIKKKLDPRTNMGYTVGTVNNMYKRATLKRLVVHYQPAVSQSTTGQLLGFMDNDPDTAWPIITTSNPGVISRASTLNSCKEFAIYEHCEIRYKNNAQTDAIYTNANGSDERITEWGAFYIYAATSFAGIVGDIGSLRISGEIEFYDRQLATSLAGAYSGDYIYDAPLTPFGATTDYSVISLAFGRNDVTATNMAGVLTTDNNQYPMTDNTLAPTTLMLPPGIYDLGFEVATNSACLTALFSETLGTGVTKLASTIANVTYRLTGTTNFGNSFHIRIKVDEQVNSSGYPNKFSGQTATAWNGNMGSIKIQWRSGASASPIASAKFEVIPLNMWMGNTTTLQCHKEDEHVEYKRRSSADNEDNKSQMSAYEEIEHMEYELNKLKLQHGLGNVTPMAGHFR